MALTKKFHTLAACFVASALIFSGAMSASAVEVKLSADSEEGITPAPGLLDNDIVSVDPVTAKTIYPAYKARAPEVDRLGGGDRYGTAVEVSKSGWPGTAPVVYIASGENFPDALSAAPAAALQGGPVLLTRFGKLPSEVIAEIDRLNPDRIVIVGGTGAISSVVESELGSLATSVVRVGGIDRYETSRLLAKATFSADVPIIYLATGRNYPDALTAGAAAGKNKSPVLLVDGGKASLDAPTVDLITSLSPGRIVLVGGEGVLSEEIGRQALDIVPDGIRYGGSTRYDTAYDLIGGEWGSAPKVFFASGENFPDAVVGSALAGMTGAPLFLVRRDCVPPTGNLHTELGVKEITVFGGEGVITERALETLCGEQS